MTSPDPAGLPKRHCQLGNLRLAYAELGRGNHPLVFLHGNPTSSYLWRNVIRPLSATGRCLAPDLVGMGDSDKLPGADPDRYSLAVHQAVIDAWLEALVPSGPLTLVLHDWGSALGFDWARRHPDRVRGIAYMEALVCPISWAQWPEPGRGLFQALRSSAGEQLILEKNVFIERILPGSILRRLTDAEMAEYRRPFLEAGESRRAMLAWPRALPIDGEPPEVVARVTQYADWLATSPVPKLFINAEPGAVLVGEQREVCRRWPSQTEVTVPGIHFVQEDSPAEIASALTEWLSALPAVPAQGTG